MEQDCPLASSDIMGGATALCYSGVGQAHGSLITHYGTSSEGSARDQSIKGVRARKHLQIYRS